MAQNSSDALESIIVKLLEESKPLQVLAFIILLLVLISRARSFISFFADLFFGDLDDKRSRLIDDQARIITQNQTLVTNYQEMITQYQQLLDSLDKTQPSREKVFNDEPENGTVQSAENPAGEL